MNTSQQLTLITWEVSQQHGIHEIQMPWTVERRIDREIEQAILEVRTNVHRNVREASLFTEDFKVLVEMLRTEGLIVDGTFPKYVKEIVYRGIKLWPCHEQPSGRIVFYA